MTKILKRIWKDDLEELLKKHAQHVYWGGEEVSFANLEIQNADFSNYNLCGVDFSNSYFINANFSGSDLSRANFSNTNLYRSNFSECECSNTNFTNARLSKSILDVTKVSASNFHKAKLDSALISNVNFSSSCLDEASFHNANIQHVMGLPGMICPDGEFKGYFKALNIPRVPSWARDLRNNYVIVEVLIPDDAKRLSGTGRLCRSDKMKVLSITNLDGIDAGFEAYVGRKVYCKGAEYNAPSFDDNRWNMDGNAFHFFLTREEAENNWACGEDYAWCK